MKTIAFFALVCSILPAGLAPVEFDWTRFTVKVTTTEKTDITDLLFNALLTIQYDETRTVEDYLASHQGSDEVIIKCITNCTSTQQNFLTDGGIEYIHQLDLTDKIMHLLLPIQHPVRFVVPMLCPCCGQKWPENRPVQDTIELVPQQIDKTDYTGIVFDCRGYPIKPCLFPKIVTDEDEEVYSADFASLSSLTEWGLAQYSNDKDLTPPRAGRKPLVVPAIGITGAKQTNIVISIADAQRIHGSKENVQLLKECRVVIIFSQ
ncbi:hypothetical protein JXB22_06205 [candidate division WOR-3 bacterium]|nr:hypothetical protein [candidate division WOR-3 bacterium]